MVQALTFVADLKLGHYMKIPPRMMFAAQVVGTVVSGAANLITAIFLIETIPNICTQEAYPFTCVSANVFNSASVIWGVIGPAKFFGIGSQYAALNWFFLIGLLAPIPFWYLSKKYPNSIWKYVHTPVIFSAIGILPPAQAISYPSYFIVAFIFQYIIYRRHRAWWERYTYITSAAMDAGTAIMGILIFLILQNNGIEVSWWGNDPDDLEHCPLAAEPLIGPYAPANQ